MMKNGRYSDAQIMMIFSAGLFVIFLIVKSSVATMSNKPSLELSLPVRLSRSGAVSAIAVMLLEQHRWTQTKSHRLLARL